MFIFDSNNLVYFIVPVLDINGEKLKLVLVYHFNNRPT